MNLAIFKNLTNPTHLFAMIGSSFLFFDLNYLIMTRFPGTRDSMCVIGGNFTVANIIFSVALSLMAGLMIAGVLALYKQRKTKLAASSISGAGLLVGSFTVFCMTCGIPVVSLFGLSIGLSFITTYNLLFKVASLLFMIGGLYLLNKQLDDECEICEV